MSHATTQPNSSDHGAKPAMPGQVAEQFSSECCESREDFQALMEEIGGSVADYCRKRPLVAGLTVFAMGFYLGWRVKPW